jgi:hypothetical protein
MGRGTAGEGIPRLVHLLNRRLGPAADGQALSGDGVWPRSQPRSPAHSGVAQSDPEVLFSLLPVAGSARNERPMPVQASKERVVGRDLVPLPISGRPNLARHLGLLRVEERKPPDQDRAEHDSLGDPSLIGSGDAAEQLLATLSVVERGEGDLFRIPQPARLPQLDDLQLVQVEVGCWRRAEIGYERSERAERGYCDTAGKELASVHGLRSSCAAQPGC